MIAEVEGGRVEWVDYATEGAWSSTRTGGGRGFNQATEDCGPSRGLLRTEGAAG